MPGVAALQSAWAYCAVQVATDCSAVVSSVPRTSLLALAKASARDWAADIAHALAQAGEQLLFADNPAAIHFQSGQVANFERADEQAAAP